MTREGLLFQQSLVPQLPVKFSWRRAAGWGCVIVDLALTMVYSEWKPGYITFPTWFLLSVTRLRQAAEHEVVTPDGAGQENGN